jgi:hypothetical protein
MKTPILCTTENSIYNMLDCDPWPASRDIANFNGTSAIVAHPPCGFWSTLRFIIRSTPQREREQKRLAYMCLDFLWANGGVMEHPARSAFWRMIGMDGSHDPTGHGFFLRVLQKWWGHRANKPTILYICGCRPKQLPPIPFDLRCPDVCVSNISSRKYHRLPEMPKKERLATPLPFALWLLSVAQICERNKS